MEKDKLMIALFERATEIQNSQSEVQSLNIVVINGKLVVNNVEYK